MKKLNRKQFLFYLKEFLIINFGALLAAVAIYFFMLPSHIAVGSGSALAMVASNYIPLPVSVLSLALNVILLTIGFILIGPAFGAKTVYTSIMLPIFMGVFEWLFPNFQSLTQDPLLDLICYILIVGMAMAILFSRNASSGGLDIVAKILNKFFKIELGRAGALAGIAVALTSALCYDTKTVVLSVLGTYFGGIVVDHFIFGLNIKRRVCVISPKLDEIVQFILHDLHSGATLNEIIGAYDNTPRKEVITIVDKHEYRKLMEFVRRVDPKAFVTVYSVGEIRYQPKIKP
ncbi:MAG: YitT family protein [Ruminococcaceae bacterium]|nr:YitT family protein [Oscillospiraceae bacterium]